MVTLVLLSAQAYSGQTSGWGKITRLYVNADSTVLRVTFDRPTVDPDNCGNSSSFYMKEIMGENKVFVSAVMAAFHSQREVRFWIAGCTSIEYWGQKRPVLYDIEAKP